MSDEKWVPSHDEIERLRSLGSPSDSDRRFAQTFAAVARAIDGCGKDSERVTLLLSTCRNEFLTANAIFADLRIALGATSTRDSPFGRALRGLRSDGRSRAWAEARESLGLLLGQARDKRRTWDDRERLREVYVASASALGGTARDDAMGILSSSPAARHESGKVWPAQYTRISTKLSQCADQLDELRALTDLCFATYSLLGKLALVDAAAREAERVRAPAPLFGDDETLFSDGFVHWDQVISEARSRLSWHVRDHAGAVTVTIRDLPEPGANEGWPHNGTVRQATVFESTPIGTESIDQLDRLVDLAETSVDAARLRLRRGFRANVADRPMPDPFLIDLGSHEPTDSQMPRSFKLVYSRLKDENRSDHTRVASLRIAIPEEWHNHQGHYRYNPDIADVDDILRLVVEAMDIAADQGVRFLFLPESFIPRGHLRTVKDHAARRSLNLIGGLEGRRVDEGCVNEAILYFPESGTELYQGKQGPSVYEIRNTRFVTDGRFQIVRDTLLGTVGVVICSDFLETDVIHQIGVRTAHRLHALIVIARNPRSDVFDVLAHADAIRLYSNVVIVNSTDGSARADGGHDTGGCIVASPYGTGIQRPSARVSLKRLTHAPEYFAEPELLIWELNVSGVHSRLNRRQDKHFLTPTEFAKQG